MSFYEKLAPYYDQIFPANDAAIHFLGSQFEYEQTILDIGAGSGNMAIALTKRGLNVIAMEPDEKMAQSIIDKSVTEGLEIPVHKIGMQQLDEIKESVDGMYCIGNTIPHLHDVQEVEAFINECYEKIREDGKLVLQLVNYEKVLSSVESFTFPVIETNSIRFTRHYEQVEEKILFTTNLTVNNKNYTNTIPLYPVTATQLISLLNAAGFQFIEKFGGFKKQEYTKDSPALIVVAKK
jgi:glycine/sarcosine N-methyltransferase